ncbi:MAG: HAMP domain-containing histidine kinase [Ktedonobacterales bacterium]|nr:HAMP domain-containing histidine kinase [Ktedonobacterales bacterium]
MSAPTLPVWARLGLRWLVVMAASLGLALLWLILDLRPSPGHVAQLTLCLIVSGVLSLGIGAGAFWLADAVKLRNLAVKFAIPSLVAAMVIALNTMAAAQLMFISLEDAQVLIAFLSFGVCIALVLSQSLLTPMTQAIQQLTTGADRMAAGEYTVRLPETTTGSVREFAQLAADFNHMAASVQEAFARRDAAEGQRRGVIAAISHDVRTPLSVMRAMLEAIDDGVVDDPAIVARYHHAIRAELQHLSALIDDLFEISRIESGAIRLVPAWVSVGDLISDTMETMREQAAQRGIRLMGEVQPGMPAAWADARQIYRVLANLTQNALRHTTAGSVIALQAAAEEGAIMVIVADSGEGITATDLPHIFEPAYRGEASRQRDPEAIGHAPGSTGLGLAIARGLVEAHGGTITALSPLPTAWRARIDAHNAMPGTLVRFTLPVGTPLPSSPIPTAPRTDAIVRDSSRV